MRFPSDGKISAIHAPFSHTFIAEDARWGRIQVMDAFSSYITTELRRIYPNIILSADVFGLVTNHDIVSIGQNLESFLLYFDYVGPMVYPSHYASGSFGFKRPDDHPYEIIANALKNAHERIDTLNENIESFKKGERELKI